MIEHCVRALHVGGVEIGEINRFQSDTASKHIVESLYVCSIEALEIERLQSGTPFKHLTHIRHVGCVEVREINLLQRRTAPEQTTHIRHVFSIEIFQPFDRGECFIIEKPSKHSGRAIVLEGGIKHHLCGRGVGVFFCTGPCREEVVFSICLINVPCGSGARVAQRVIVESECCLVRILQHIGFHHIFRCILSEISRFGVGHLDIRLVGIVSHCALESGASFKHAFGVQALPRLFRNDGSEFLTATEHTGHIKGFLCIEVPKIERLQRAAAVEHKSHKLRLFSVEVREIKRLHHAALCKHITHTPHFCRVEVFDIDRFQPRTSPEHITHIIHVCGVEVRDI